MQSNCKHRPKLRTANKGQPGNKQLVIPWPDMNLHICGQVETRLRLHFTVLLTLADHCLHIPLFGSHCIVTWSICSLFSLLQHIHLAKSDLKSNQQSSTCVDKIPNVRQTCSVFDSELRNMCLIANLWALSERAATAEQYMYWSCYETIRSNLLNWSASCEVDIPGCCQYNWPNCTGPGNTVWTPVATV